MSAPKQRVSDERLAAFCEPVGFGVSRGEWVTDLALDLRDARAELARLQPVVEAARKWRECPAHADGCPVGCRACELDAALCFALDALREKEGG